MATPVPVLVVGALFVGGAAGVAVEQAGLSPIPEPDAETVVEEPGVVLGPAVSVHDCPDGVPIAVLAGGDGVLATGRTEDGLWIEIRSPLDTTLPAWMSAGTLDPDGDLADLPVHECGVEATATTTASTTTSSTTTTSTSTSTTTTVPGETTVPSTTQPRPTTTPPTTAPPPPDTSPPRIGVPAASPLSITTAPDGDQCGDDPMTSLVTVSVTDNRPGLVVTMSFRTVSQGNTVFSGGALNVQGPTNNVFRATVGPLEQSAATAGAPTFAEITIVARDAAGNTVQRVFTGPQVVRC